MRILGGFRRTLGHVVRFVMNWASLLAIPTGIVAGLKGYRTLGALLVLGGTLAYFLVDPILILLDLLPKELKSRSKKA